MASATVPTIGKPSCVSPARVESSNATTPSGRYRSTPRAVLPKCGSPERPSARIRSLRGRDAKSGSGRGKLHAVGECDAGPRVVGEQEVAVEVDVIHERGDVGAGGDAEAGLDHAAEHHAQSERPCRSDHPNRLADAARLRELDVDPVRTFGAGGDVAEVVAILV